MKAIETEYNGYRFRSRLEARWAVFLDYLGLDYQYEPEGFELEGVGRYLPDFYVPSWGAWVEVKPMPDEPNGETVVAWLRRAKPLTDGTGKVALLFLGSPGSPEDYGVGLVMPSKDGHYRGGVGYFGACSHCGSLGVFGGVVEETGHFGWGRVLPPNPPGVRCGHGSWQFTESRIERAMSAGRQARFEFGQTPKTVK